VYKWIIDKIKKYLKLLWVAMFRMVSQIILSQIDVHTTLRSRSAIADKPRCSVCKLWQKYKCEKRGVARPPPIILFLRKLG